MNSLILLMVFGAVLMYVLCVPFRILVKNPLSSVFYSVKDLILYVLHKGWNNCPVGRIIAYTALFGRGKTLSVVHYVTSMFYKYDGVKVWDRRRGKFVTQKVHVISNVNLNIPYENFVSMKQVVRVAQSFEQIDMENNTLTVTIILGDEFSVQMNSRNFKSNIDPLVLNTILTCRHHNILFIYDAQRFAHVDALLRQVTVAVIECKKIWRFMLNYEYDAFEMEYATNPSLLKPRFRGGWFIKDRDYNAYDTKACVGNLEKSAISGDMLSEEEILALQCNNPVNMDIVMNPSKKYRKFRKKMK